MVAVTHRSARPAPPEPPEPARIVAPSTISVVVCAYTLQRWDDVVRAIESLRAQTRRPDQVVLVIDHNDEMLERAADAFAAAVPVSGAPVSGVPVSGVPVSGVPVSGAPDSGSPGAEPVLAVDVVANTYRRGLSGARNTGVDWSRGDVVAFLDDDAAAGPNWIDGLLTAYADPDVAGVGGGATPDWGGQGAPAWFPDEFGWVVGCSYRGLPETAGEVRNFIGCNMSFRREVFFDIGGFTEGIGRVGTRPVGCEETEFCIRLRQRHPGARLVFDPELDVRHRVSPDRRAWRYFRTRCYSEGLSKAVVARNVGAGAGLASERAYTTRVLPGGVARGVASGLRGDPVGFVRAGAIVAGLALTSLGYARGRLARSGRRS